MTELTKLPDGTDAIRFYGGENMPVEIERGGLVYPKNGTYVADEIATPGNAVSQAVANLGDTEFRDRFADHPNGVPSASVNGAPYLLAGTHNSSVTVTDGKLVPVMPETAVATYTQVELRGSGIRIGARFTFSSYSGDTGAICIGFWAAPMDSDSGTPVQDSPCHLVITPQHWAFGVWQNNTIDDLRSTFFGTPLTADDSTVHTAEVFIDRERGSAYVSLPDGSYVTIIDPRIGSIEAPYAFIEHYRSALTGSVPTFVDWWADSTSRSPVATARVLAPIPKGKTVAVYNPTPAAPSTAPWLVKTTGAVIDGTNVAVTHTASTPKVLVTVQAFVKFFAIGNYFWSINLVSSVVGNAVKIADGGDKSVISEDRVAVAHFLIPGLNVGQTYAFQLRHIASVNDCAIVQADGPNSNPIVMTAESIV